MLVKAYGKTWKERSSIEKEKAKFLQLVLDCCSDENLVGVGKGERHMLEGMDVQVQIRDVVKSIFE